MVVIYFLIVPLRLFSQLKDPEQWNENNIAFTPYVSLKAFTTLRLPLNHNLR